MAKAGKSWRAFKTAWFAKAARKNRISDHELCEAMREVMSGQADDLGGGVFKKRLNKNMHRSIVLAKEADTGYSPISSQKRSREYR